MISFTCTCGKLFKVPDAYAGRSAKCKICGNMVQVPVLEEPVEMAIADSAISVGNSIPGESVSAAEKVEHYDSSEPKIEDHDSSKEQTPEADQPSAKINDSPEPIEEHASSNESTFEGALPGIDAPSPGLDSPASTIDPPPPILQPQSSIPYRIPMRTRRLRADAESMQAAFENFPAIRVEPLEGNPPESYRVHYLINSLAPGPEGKPIPQAEHEIEIQLTSEYPRLSPRCKILTPIFHPNFDPATICVGDHWTAGERLVDLVVRIGEMIAYQAYNIQSPLDAEAAMWADLNRDQLPTDARDLRPADLE